MKVVLREWKKSDSTALAKIANNKKIWDNVRDRLPYPYTEQDAKEWLALVKKQKIVTTFCVEADGELAGSIGFTLKEDVYRKSAEIGYFIGENFWGQGIATEAIRVTAMISTVAMIGEMAPLCPFRPYRGFIVFRLDSIRYISWLNM